MGLLLTGMLAGILIGYGLLAPSLASLQECSPQGCFEKIAASQPMEPKSTPFATNPAIANAKSATGARSRKRSSAKSGRRTDLVKNAHPPTRISVPASDRPADTSDPVLNKAKNSVAAKMEDPASAEFGDMKRAIRKNTFGRPVDTICGHVRGKNPSGGDTGERPFLYLVKEDDAYVVDGKTGSAAAIAYRNICN
jgi:hypothetical protein